MFRMGIPVTQEHLSSNIQGLPTRQHPLSKAGYAARREDYQVLVAMNQQTMAEDIQNPARGGVRLSAGRSPD
jgi:hypothetical protein